MSLTASVEGVDRLAATLTDAASDLVRLAPSPQAGDKLVSAALPRTPVRIGRLRRTVRAFVVDQQLVLTAGGGAVDYAAIIHARRPWLADTLAEQADEVVDTVADQVTHIIDTIQGA